MKKIFKSGLSIFIALCMMAMNIPMVMATDIDNNLDARGNFGMVFLGTGTTPALNAVAMPNAKADWVSTTEAAASGGTATKFWVGIYLENLSKLDAAGHNHFFGEDVADVNGSGYGLFNINTSLQYDNRYVVPVTTTTKVAAMRNNTIKLAGSTWSKLKSTASKDLQYIETEDTGNNLYKVSDASDEKIETWDSATYEDSAITNPEIWHVQATIEASDLPSNGAIFDTPATLTDDRLFVLAVQFELKDKPSTPTQVFDVGRNPTYFSLQTGSDGTMWKGTWNKTRETGAEDGNLKYHLNYDGAADFFPASYDVNFYTDNTYGTKVTSNSGATLGASGVANNTEIGEGEGQVKIVEPEVGTPAEGYTPDLESPNSDGKYFAGWEYVDATGTTHPFKAKDGDPGLTKVSGDAAVANGSDPGYEIKLYPTWAEPYKVTFHSNYNDTKTDATSPIADETAIEVNVAPDNASKVTAPDTSAWTKKTGYVITGWTTADGTAFDIANTDITANSTDLYAVWEQNLKVEYALQDGAAWSGTAPSAVSGKPDAAFTLTSEVPTLTGYTFDGWNTKENGTGTKITASHNTIQSVHDQATADGITITNGTVTLYPIWKVSGDKVTLTFDAVGGKFADNSGTYAVDIPKGGTIKTWQMPQNPTKAGTGSYTYSFKGWFEEADFTNNTGFNFSAALNEDDTAYAHWDYKDSGDADKKKVTFKYNDGATADAEYYVATGQSVGSVPAAPDRTGWTFSGWTWDDDGNAGTPEVVFTADTLINADTEVHGNWMQNVTIEYDGNVPAGSTNTATGIPAKEENKKPTDPYTFPTAPTRNKYDFAGWSTAANGSGTQITAANAATVASNYKAIADIATANGVDISSGTVKLYAVWTPKTTEEKWTLTFDSVGGSATVPPSISVVKGDPISADMLPADPTKTDYTKVDGWFKDADTNSVDKFAFPLTLTEDDTAYAHWTYTGSNPVIVTFDSDGGSAGTLTYTIGRGDSLGFTPSAGTKDGYGFNKWVIDGSDTEFTASTTVNADTNVKAVWTQNLTVHYNLNYTSAPAGPADKSGAPDAAYSNPTAPTRTDYSFKEWNTATNGAGTTIDATKTKYNQVVTTGTEITLYAQWTPTADAKTLTFNPNNLPSASQNDAKLKPTTVSVNKNDYVTGTMIPTIAKNEKIGDYKFLGWFETAAAGSAEVSFADPGLRLEDNKTVYAHWDYEGANAATITFMDGTDTHATVTVDPSATTTLGTLMPADPSHTDKDFKQWNTAADGSGTQFKSDTPIAGNLTVHAVYLPNVTVKYNANGGTGGPADAANQLRKTTYADPDVTGMSKTGANGAYKFIGWNTKQNGSGSYVEAGTGVTYGTVSDLFKANAADEYGPSEVTLYAQWAAVTDPDNPVDPDPTTKGVKVTFHNNDSAEARANPGVNPTTKFPELGDSIAQADMPNAPERAQYEFKGWNTKPDGTGTAFAAVGAGSIAITTDAISDLKAVSGTTTAYTLEVYAIWEANPDNPSDKITLTFMNNLTPNAKVAEETIVKGHSLGHDVTAPANPDKDFMGWFPVDASGKFIAGGKEFNKDDTTITADTTYYAKWKTYVLVVPHVTPIPAASDADTELATLYTGQNIYPDLELFEVTYPDGDTSQPYVISKKISNPADAANGYYKANDTTSFSVKYEKDGAEVTDMKDVGTYIKMDVKIIGGDLKEQGYEVAVMSPDQIKVEKAALTVSVDPATQVTKKKTGEAISKATVTITGFVGDDAAKTDAEKAALAPVNYYKWDDADKNGVIADTELTKVTDITDTGKYVIKVELPAVSNYELVSGVKSLSTADPKENVKLYETSVYNPTGTAQNIYYEVKANDSSAQSLTINGVEAGDWDNNPATPETDRRTNLSLKDNTYKTDKPFNNNEVTTEEENTYYSVVSKKTHAMDVTVVPKNPDDTTVKIVLGTTEYTEANGKLTKTVADDGTVTYKATVEDLDPKELNAIKVQMSVGDPTVDKTYTINVQRSLAQIKLGFGNSPYGLIERMANEGWDAAKIQQAKDEFNNSHATRKKYGTLVPTDGQTKLTYTTKAWNSYTGFDKDEEGNAVDYNGDMDPTAMFVFQRRNFKDVGFEAFNAAGQPLEAEVKVTRSVTVKTMANGVPSYVKANDTKEKITDLPFSTDDSNTNHVFTELVGKNVRPDVYRMTYTFTDPLTDEVISQERKLIVVSKHGDALINNDNAVNNPDASAIVTKKGIMNAGNSLYRFRIADALVNNDDTVNNPDASKIVTEKSKLGEFYIYLPTE